jgi:hypothetical protein
VPDPLSSHSRIFPSQGGRPIVQRDDGAGRPIGTTCQRRPRIGSGCPPPAPRGNRGGVPLMGPRSEVARVDDNASSVASVRLPWRTPYECRGEGGKGRSGGGGFWTFRRISRPTRHATPGRRLRDAFASLIREDSSAAHDLPTCACMRTGEYPELPRDPAGAPARPWLVAYLVPGFSGAHTPEEGSSGNGT